MHSFRLFKIEDACQKHGFSISSSEETALKMYELLESSKESILSKTDEFTLEDLWYSQYYWFLVLMKERGVETQADYQQQLFKILDSMDWYLCIDWEIIEQLEKDIL